MLARIPCLDRPETRGVGGQAFVDEQKFFAEQPEFELGIGDDHAGPRSLYPAVVVDLEAGLAHRVGEIIAEQAAAFFPGNRFVMTLGCLCCRGEEGLGKFGCLAQSARHVMSAHRSVFPVFLPSRTGQIPADDTFDGQGLCLAAEHGATGQLAGKGLQLGWKGGKVRRKEVIGHEVQPPEPKSGELGQQLPLARNRVGQDAIEGGETVARHQKHAVSRRVDLADFAAAHQFPARKFKLHHPGALTTGPLPPRKVQRRGPQIPWIRPAPRLACAALWNS